MSESKLQSKIIAWLESRGFYAVKTIVCSKNGVPDILCCSPSGKFCAIEVKYGANKPSKLQEFNIHRINQRGGIAFTAWDLETVILRLEGEIKP